MAVSMQVIYPITEDTTFDFDYYFSTHMQVVDDNMGPHIQQVVATKGIAGGPNTPPGIYAIATILFPDQAAMDAAMANSRPVVGDIPNFYNAQPTMLIGEVIG